MTLALDTSQARKKRSFWTMARRDAATGYLFIAPQLIGIVIFVLIPLGLVFWYSLHEWNVLAGSFRFTGTANYEKLLSDPAIGEVMSVTAVFSAGLALLNMSLALGLALLLNQKLRFMTLFRTLFFSPVVVSLVARTIVWSFLLQSNGGINGLLQMIGVEGPNWLRNLTTAMISVIVVQALKNVGLNMILFLAALQGVPRELF
ncbi:sugar ABC transporter permease [Devosia sp. A8/3-2]|nr:sugar ABC transporter permease [Devosia sp. A8/3-2]